MKTVTKKEDFTYIVYDEELKRKCDIVLSLHTILWVLIPVYILLFRVNDKIYNYLWIIFYVFFIISYRLEPYLSKIKIILYGDRIEIKRGRKKKLYLYSEIKKIEYIEKDRGREGTIYFVKIMKNDGSICKQIKGELKSDIIEIFTTIKISYEEWRIKNDESYNK
ncbi:hypothetical protein [Fusobacterium periodonticum]|uniref:DUF304 domain-containing protein n=1 Tax=Fusobacterium periodonticum D10 TaxID=620833 RepID=K1GDV4_9FUSO|nr:hypothetical protein [Fusobacterium periodonticum]EKA92289.1 hypothetical protein FPOG_02491 [Fusobacterium periodonticum D10]